MRILFFKSFAMKSYKINRLRSQIGLKINFTKKLSFPMKHIFFSVLMSTRQNCRVWGTKNSHVAVEKPMHLQRVTIWCEILSGGIIGQFVFMLYCACHNLYFSQIFKNRKMAPQSCDLMFFFSIFSEVWKRINAMQTN